MDNVRDSPTDAELVFSIGEGDASAENKFCLMHYNYVRGAVRRKIPHQDVEDVSQLVMWAACFNLRRKKFKADVTLKRYLAGIVNKKVQQYWRGKLRNTETELTPNSSYKYATQEMEFIVQELYILLTPKQQTIFTRHNIQGLTISEIAIKEKIPAGTVGRILSEIKHKFRKILEVKP